MMNMQKLGTVSLVANLLKLFKNPRKINAMHCNDYTLCE